jgi:hypothetical protein
MGKLDHNHERAQTTSHNEHKHQNADQTRAGCHKPLTHWIYQTQPGMPLLRSMKGYLEKWKTRYVKADQIRERNRFFRRHIKKKPKKKKKKQKKKNLFNEVEK